MDQVRTISMTDALSCAWLRMKLLLFRPFNLELWFAVGFSSFLAGLGEGSGSSGLNWHEDWGGRRPWSGDWSAGRDEVMGFWESINWEPWVVLLGGFLVMLGLVLAVLFLWLSSRGQFMFLDNLITRRGEIRTPWRKYRNHGISLFWWRLGYALVCLMVFGGMGLLALLVFLPLGIADAGALVAVPAAILLGTLGFILVVGAVYIEFFLWAFIVPIMYREGLSTTQAWARFSPLFKEHSATFVLFGLFYLLVAILGTMALFFLGVMTCCLGLLLLALPYIGSVVSLPLSVLQRYWSLEFLGRFGPELDLLGPIPGDSGPGSIYDDGDGTVIGSEDPGQDAGRDQTGPESP